MLQEIRLGNISETTWDRPSQKAAAYKPCFSLESLVTTTHIVSYKQTAEQINHIVNNALPLENEKFAISEAIDFINGVQQNPETVQSVFKLKTNLPPSVRIQQGSRVMYLNNSLIEKGICNGTIGIVTDFDKDTSSVLRTKCNSPSLGAKTYFLLLRFRAKSVAYPISFTKLIRFNNT